MAFYEYRTHHAWGKSGWILVEIRPNKRHTEKEVKKAFVKNILDEESYTNGFSRGLDIRKAKPSYEWLIKKITSHLCDVKYHKQERIRLKKLLKYYFPKRRH
jgi:hypothetical protein